VKFRLKLRHLLYAGVILFVLLFALAMMFPPFRILFEMLNIKWSLMEVKL
jgi:hypothetical protein